MLVQVALVGRHVFGIPDSVGLGVLTHSVGTTGQEARVGTLGMTVRETVMRMARRMSTKARHVAVAGGVLSKDVVEASLGVDTVFLFAGEPIRIETLDAPPAAALAVATPEEI